MQQSVIAGTDLRADLLKDMERDPEGHFYATIAGDRRLPPWFGSGASAAPEDIQRRVRQFIEDRVEGQNPNHYELRHNWYDRQFEFLRWVPDWDYQDKFEQIGLVVWTPLTLEIWSEDQGWLPQGQKLFDYLWRCFLTNDHRDSAERQKYEAVKEAWVHVNRMSSTVASGRATNEELEEFAHWLNIADRDGWAESYELAKEMKPFLDKTADDLGIY